MLTIMNYRVKLEKVIARERCDYEEFIQTRWRDAVKINGCLHVKGECSMAMSKKTAKPATKVQAKEEVKKTEVKAEVKPVEMKVEQMELDVTAESKKVAETAVAEKKETAAKKTEEKKPAAKKTAAKKTTTAKKETVKKETAKKEAVKAAVHVQFNGKSYETEDFVKIAKDIWKFDLKKKATDFKNVEIYVKPEENRAYYVINGEVDGSFGI